ncbi:MAG: GNAT family N-acetyltransferase [Elusimicrobiota bacterium]|jgi:ribosomal protein S18 acetylase RimI-like enzyme
MQPFLRPGDELFVRAFSSSTTLKIGDILLYRQTEHDNPVAHRLRCIRRLSAGPNYFGVAGDELPLAIEWIREDQLIGRLEMVKRGSRIFLEKDLRRRYFLFLFIRYGPSWMKRQVKMAGIRVLSWVQSFHLYRVLFRVYLASRVRINRMEEEGAFVFQAFIGSWKAGYVFLVVKPNQKENIKDLLVRAWVRGGGIATLLLGELIRTARQQGVRELCLTVESDNQAALRLYRSLGFQQAGEPSAPMAFLCKTLLEAENSPASGGLESALKTDHADRNQNDRTPCQHQ